MRPKLRALKDDLKTDILIIGAGYCGLSAALHLSEQGYHSTVIDAHEPGWGASGRNGGQVIPGLKVFPEEMKARFGNERGERIATSVGATPDLVYDLIKRYKIDCDLVQTGWIQLAKGPVGRKTTDAHIDQWRSRKVDVQELSKADIQTKVGTNAYVSGLLDPRGGNLHPLKYARGLAHACLSKGVSIHSDTPALSVERVNSHWLVKTAFAKITADTVIVCTNGYSGDMLPGLSNSIVPVLTGVVATEPLSDNQAKSILPKRQAAADTRRLLSWFGFDSKNRLLFGSRINFQKELIDVRNFQFGLQRMHEIFPDVDNTKLNHMWTGRVALTLDHVPHIHKLADGLFSGLGFNGRGVAMASLMGKILAGHASGISNGDEFLPLTPMPKIPMSRFRNTGVAVALTWKRFLDTARP